MELYFDQLKRYIALYSTRLNIFELSMKIDYLANFYKKYKFDFILRDKNEFINETYNLLIQLNLKSKKETFIKSIKNQEVVLEFEKQEEGKKNYIYVIGFIFRYLSEIKDNEDNLLFDFSKVKFTINESSKTFSELKRAAKKNVDHYISTNLDWINHISPIFPQIEFWYNNSLRLFDFRPPLFIDNPF